MVTYHADKNYLIFNEWNKKKEQFVQNGLKINHLLHILPKSTAILSFRTKKKSMDTLSSSTDWCTSKSIMKWVFFPSYILKENQNSKRIKDKQGDGCQTDWMFMAHMSISQFINILQSSS